VIWCGVIWFGVVRCVYSMNIPAMLSCILKADVTFDFILHYSICVYILFAIYFHENSLMLNNNTDIN
jgi:hypothetical protein